MTTRNIKKFRTYQFEADNAIYQEMNVCGNAKGIIQMFCGTGKSLLMRDCKTAQRLPLSVYVFPTLSLIKQFYEEYLEIPNEPNNHILKISSEQASTTDPDVIQQFLRKSFNKIICVTYQSYKTLLENLGTHIIDLCIFDEAHHAVGEIYQTLIFENTICAKQLFFTATPKNANGIIMYDREHPETNMCGNLIYKYSYYDGLLEGYLNPFEIRIDLYTENTNHSVYESIARAILTTGNNRVLTFHSDVNTDRETSVTNFVNEPLLIKAFKHVLKTEFPKLARKYRSVKMVGLSSAVPLDVRGKILEAFDGTPDNEIIVMASCETIGEGIDTKNANMCVFVDPKTSVVKIIQNIGRIVRKLEGIYKKPSTILIPCWVDRTKYLECDGDREKCDAVIREDMGTQGNFNGILNVASAVKQEDEDLYDMCLKYPTMYSPQEIERNLDTCGYTMDDVVGEGTMLETMEHLLDTEDDYNVYEDCENDEEMLMRIAENNNICIEVHSNSLENPVETYNASDGTHNGIIRMYKNTEDEDNVYYQPIVDKTTGNKCEPADKIGALKPPDKNRRINNGINVHSNNEIKVLWKMVADMDLTRDVCSCIIDCEIVDKTEYWIQKLDEVKIYIDTNNKRPSKDDKDKTIKSLEGWIRTQKTNYNTDILKSKGVIKEKEIHDLWTIFIEEYKEYICIDLNENWKNTLNKVKLYIDTNKKRPSSKDKDKTIKSLAGWIGTQKKNYNTDISKSNDRMKEKEMHDLWTNFINDEEYK